ncbi:MAG: hypothetical protein KAR33_13355 [Candidatus Thorarchaeota archaeon]|nr:hypothetical protein [Candidatus Thorarchaeota archaeon]
MQDDVKSTPLQHAMLMGMIYGFLILFVVLLYFSTGWMLTSHVDFRLRAFILAWIAGIMIILVGLQMLKCLFHSGLNPITLSSFGFLNVAFVGMQLAVYADLVVSDVTDTPVALVVMSLLIGCIGTFLLVLWMVWAWMKARRIE